MKAVEFNLSIPKYAAALAAGKWMPSLHYGRLSMIRYRADRPDAPLPNDEWARLRTIRSGVCGSDIAALFLKMSPSVEPFSSFPTVFGHEVLAEVIELGKAAKGVRVGDRVAVEPFLGCRARGVTPPCPPCEKGLYSICRNVAEGPMAPGIICGGCRDAPGGWAERMAAHPYHLFRVPDTIPDRLGAMIEPLSIGMHAVLRRGPAEGDKVLVIGGGMIAYAVIAALRMLGIRCEIAHASLLDYQSEMGLALGTDEPIVGGGRAFEERVSEITGARRFKPMLGQAIFKGGFDLVYDCIGSAQSLGDAIRATRERGTVVLVGAAGKLSGVDWTQVWTHEVDIVGVVGYGVEPARRGKRTFEVLIDKLRKTELPLDRLVTHEFPLEGYQEAIRANVDRVGTRSIKTLFAFD